MSRKTIRRVSHKVSKIRFDDKPVIQHLYKSKNPIGRDNAIKAIQKISDAIHKDDKTRRMFSVSLVFENGMIRGAKATTPGKRVIAYDPFDSDGGEDLGDIVGFYIFHDL